MRGHLRQEHLLNNMAKTLFAQTGYVTGFIGSTACLFLFFFKKVHRLYDLFFVLLSGPDDHNSF